MTLQTIATTMTTNRQFLLGCAFMLGAPSAIAYLLLIGLSK